MTILVISIIIFILILASGYAGLHMQKRLADEHKTDQSRGVVGQVAGLVSLLLALVLGTLIGVSFAYFSTQKTELEGFSAQILRLDQALAQYGPEPSRRETSSRRVLSKAMRHSGEAERPTQICSPQRCHWPARRRWATFSRRFSRKRRRRAGFGDGEPVQQHGRAIATADVPTSRESAGIVGVLIAILLFWTLALFFGIGLFAESNSLVLSALACGALSIAFAIFLILELGLPYTGLMRVSPAALEQAIGIRRQVGARSRRPPPLTVRSSMC